MPSTGCQENYYGEIRVINYIVQTLLAGLNAMQLGSGLVTVLHGKFLLNLKLTSQSVSGDDENDEVYCIRQLGNAQEALYAKHTSERLNVCVSQVFLILWHLESCRLWTAASLRAYQTLETVLHVQSNPDSLRLTPVLDSQTQGSYVSTLVTPWRGTRPLRTATTSKSAGRVTTAVGSACCWLPLKATLGVF